MHTQDVAQHTQDVAQVPPANLEAEEAILGGILLDPGAIARVIDTLQPEHFYLEGHQRIYRAALLLHTEGKPTDLLMTIAKLEAMDLLAIVGGRNKLVTLVDRVVSAINIDALADLVVEKHRRRQMLKAADKISALAHQEYRSVGECLDDAEQEILNISSANTSAESTLLADCLVDVFRDLEERHNGTTLPGIPSGFYDLDALTCGFQRTDLIIVGARPSMGKTGFATCIVHHIASLYKLPTVIFSLEMSKQQLAKRLLAAETGIEMGYLRSGRIGKSQWEALTQAISRLGELPLHIIDAPIQNLWEMRSQLRKIAASSGELGIVAIDYIGLLEHSVTGATQNERIAKVSAFLKALAKEFRCPVVALSQLNRSVESRTNKRPIMSDLRDSGSLEQDADLILFLYRDEYYNSDSPDRGIAELIIAKHRNGPVGTVKLLFDAQVAKFKNLVHPNFPSSNW
ncbi:replicative DNA helicase [Brasilonema sp. UFV-L1]|uniref:replicative DNA helicase n=1 Tax=Brasilonema sp. UFV-L1 TaxID=2234130 RepID=UPI00145DBA5C|nr:replicative DNA helicase [Brasilonema sp. UFV-L1]NMG10366.1 replicative DNA helicase [Brasilonema sp. UFV-L1]